MPEVTLATNYSVYKHEFKNNPGMYYIGYTSKTVEQRLKNHIKNMSGGIDSHFYRAMRLYGTINIITEVLATNLTKEKALELESYYIEKYDSIKNGYNLKSGGTGGDTFSYMSEEKKKNYLKKRQELSSGYNNSNCTGVTDDEIVEHCLHIVKAQGWLSRNNYRRYAIQTKEQFNLPENISNTVFRFNGKGWNGLIKIVADKLNIAVSDLRYKKTQEHKLQLSKTSSSKRWVTNGEETIAIHKKDIELYLNKGYQKGRIFKNVEN